MAKSSRKFYVLIGIAFLILGILACGSVKIGVVTPTPEAVVQPTNDAQEPNSDFAAIEVDDIGPGGEATQTPEADIPESTDTVPVTAWLGHITSMDPSSSYDDVLVLSPEGTGELGLAGATSEIEAEIRALRDEEGPNEWVHIWGDLACDVDEINNCQVLVDKLQYGANYSEEDVQGWVGTLRSFTFNGGDSTVFELAGDFPMWYSINASQDQDLQEQIKQLRDTGSVVKVDGRLLVGIPDVNGTRIEVSSLEVIETGTQKTPEVFPDFEVSADWPVFVNDRYGYQIKYPADATISLFGPEGFSQEDLPEGMSPDQYMDSLLKEYTNRLCVKVEYSLGWIYIAAPPNAEKFLTPCGPTGLGAGEIIDKIETIAIGDQYYQAQGVEFKLRLADSDGNPITGETLDLHGEMFRIALDDGTVIRFGTMPGHDATYADYLMKTRETLFQIMATYQPVP